MHKVVELILKRMESHPEEFMSPQMKQMIDPYRQYLTVEEKEAMRAKERDIYLDVLHVRVMKQILAEPAVETDYQTMQQQQALEARKAMAQKAMNQANTWGAQDQNALLAQSMNRTKDQYAANVLNSPMTGGTLTASPTTPDTWGAVQINSLKKALGL